MFVGLEFTLEGRSSLISWSLYTHNFTKSKPLRLSIDSPPDSFQGRVIKISFLVFSIAIPCFTKLLIAENAPLLAFHRVGLVAQVQRAKTVTVIGIHHKCVSGISASTCESLSCLIPSLHAVSHQEFLKLTIWAFSPTSARSMSAATLGTWLED